MDRKLESINRLLKIMDELREKCPWDREQTFKSLITNTIEETYELTDALMGSDMNEIKKELGDVLLQVVFYAKMGSEQGAFDIGDVADAISDKLVYRHPHVFGDVDAENAGTVVRNWEALKQKERGDKTGGVLSGVPRSLPPLIKAYRIGQKAAAAGFDWTRREDSWEKVKEELGELEVEMKSGDKDKLEDEFGDVLFAMINVGRLYGVSPEQALERCNRKFIHRFNYIESKAVEQNKNVSEFSLDQMEAYWQEAKTVKQK